MTGRAKRTDYDLITQEVVATTVKIYDCRLSTESPFPEKSVELAWAHQSWKEACEICEIQLELTKHLIGIVSHASAFHSCNDMEAIPKIIGEGSHFRGALKSKAKPLVEAIYGFETGKRAAIVECNRRLVVDLKTQSGFLYKVCYYIGGQSYSQLVAPQKRPTPGNEGKGYMQNRIIQKLINSQWFKDRQDVGATFKDQFKAFPEAGLALLFTAVRIHFIHAFLTDFSSFYRWNAQLMNG